MKNKIEKQYWSTTLDNYLIYPLNLVYRFIQKKNSDKVFITQKLRNRKRYTLNLNPLQTITKKINWLLMIDCKRTYTTIYDRIRIHDLVWPTCYDLNENYFLQK